MREPHAVWSWALRLCAVASVVPLFCAQHLPMSDLPEHVATIATLRHYWDPAWRSQEYFALTGVWQTQYWLYHVVGAALSVLTGSAERANVALLAAAGLAYPYALRALLRALGRDERLALFGCALFWGQALTVGLVNYVASVPVVLFGVALAVRQATSPTRKRAVALALVALAIFYLHSSSFLLFALHALLVTWLLPVPEEGRVWKALRSRALSVPRRLAWFLPSALAAAALVLPGLLAQEKSGPIIVRFRPRPDLFHHPITRVIEQVKSLHGWCFDIWRDRVDDVLGWGLVAVAVTLVVLRTAPASWEERWRGRVTLVLFATVVAIYLTFPAQIGSYAFLLDLRLAVFVALFGVLALRPRAGLRGSLPLAVAGALALMLSVHTTREVRAFENDEVGRFDDLLRKLPRGSRLMMLNFQPHSSHVNMDPFSFFGSYYRARYGGIAAFSFSEIPHWPVQYRAAWHPPTPLSWGDPCTFRNARDGEFFEFLMTHGETDPFASTPPGPTWEVVGATRAWRLYRKVPGKTAPARATPDLGPCEGALAMGR